MTLPYGLLFPTFRSNDTELNSTKPEPSQLLFRFLTSNFKQGELQHETTLLRIRLKSSVCVAMLSAFQIEFSIQHWLNEMDKEH
jgi:hypothetical protein